MNLYSIPGGQFIDILKKITVVAFDFDGVFTNNMVYVDQSGTESVRCSRSDGIGISLLRSIGIESLVISSEINSVVQRRCQKIGVTCFNGITDKLEVLLEYLEGKKCTQENTIFVGNDINDSLILQNVGVPIVVLDSHPDVICYAKYVTNNKGGEGAVREVCDLLYHAHQGNK